MTKFITHNFWLKVLAFFLAVVVWFYVVGELNKGTPEERAFFGLVMPYKVAAKEVPIRLRLVGKPMPGYRVLEERIVVKPSTCLVMAPKNLIKDISYVATEEVNLAEFTKSVVKHVKVRPMAGGVVPENDFLVTVSIPIEKIEPEAKVTK